MLIQPPHSALQRNQHGMTVSKTCCQPCLPDPTCTLQIRVPAAPSVRDAFANELVKLSPPLLKVVDFNQCHNLRQFVLSPTSSCPVLERLHLSGCPNLEYVLVQSSSLTQLDLSGCEALTKVCVCVCGSRAGCIRASGPGKWAQSETGSTQAG